MSVERYDVSQYPEAEAAFAEARQFSGNPLEHRWSHPVVYAAGAHYGWWALRNQPAKKARPLFERAYLDCVRRARGGEVFSVPAPEPPAATASNQHQSQAARDAAWQNIAHLWEG